MNINFPFIYLYQLYLKQKNIAIKTSLEHQFLSNKKKKKIIQFIIEIHDWIISGEIYLTHVRLFDSTKDMREDKQLFRFYHQIEKYSWVLDKLAVKIKVCSAFKIALGFFIFFFLISLLLWSLLCFFFRGREYR